MTPDENRVATILSECASGASASNMALMRLCLAGTTSDYAIRLLDEAIASSEDGDPRERLLALRALWRRTPHVFDLVRSIVADDGGAAADDLDPVVRCAAAFDRAALLSPAASVALYSLGKEDILSAATTEVVAYLEGEELLGRDRRALEIGCGVGRFLAALAGKLGRIVGLDVAPAMLEEARRRCRACANVEFLLGDGRGFAALPDENFDLALAIDVFPYLVSAGPDVVRSNAAEARRVLRPGGRLIVINYSYRNDMLDCCEARELAAATGFDLRRAAVRPFRLWDGAVFDFERKRCYIDINSRIIIIM